MTIFQFEMKQYRGSTFIWAIGLAATILLLLPLFISLTGDTTAIEALADNPMLETMGITIELFSTATGIFAYLNSILLVAAAIQACNLGLSIITKEHMQNTADFLITKPYSRNYIFLNKLSAAICIIAIIGLTYFLASFGILHVLSDQEYLFSEFFQIYLTFPLIQLFFLLLGMLISTVVSRVSSPLPLALGLGF